MQRFVFWFAPICLTALCGHANARDYAFNDDATRRQTTLQIKKASIDDFLIEWGKAGQFNVLADATHFSADDATDSEPREGALGKLLLTFAAERKLNGRRYDAQTFLLWKHKADFIATARLIIARELHEAAIALPPLTKDEMHTLWSDYFRRVHSWDGKTSQINIKVKVRELPDELRQRVLSAVRNQLLEEDRRAYIWFSDEVWNHVRLHIRPGRQFQRNSILLAGIAVEEERLGEKERVYSERSIGSPDNAGGSTLEGTKVFQLEPRPEIVKPTFAFAAQNVGRPVRLAPPIDLKSDPMLDAPISLKASRLPVGQLLLEAQKQSAIVFAMSPAHPLSDVRVTARVEKMPLSNLMGALSRLYGVEWEKTDDKAYTVHGRSPDDLEARLLRIYPWETFPLFATPQKSQEVQQQDMEEVDEIWENIDDAAAKSDAGLPFQEVMPDIQQKIRDRIEKRLSMSLGKHYQDVQEKLDEDLELHFLPGQPTVPMSAGTGQPVQDANDELAKLHLTVHLPADTPLMPRVPSVVEPDAGKRLWRETQIAWIFRTFPSGRDPNPWSRENIERQRNETLQRIRNMQTDLATKRRK